MKTEEVTHATDRKGSLFVAGIAYSPRLAFRLFFSYFSFLKLRKRAGKVFYNTLRDAGISEREARSLMIEYVQMMGLKRILSMMRRI